MSMYEDARFARQVIMDHYEHPHNKHIGDDTYNHKHMSSDSCIDDITVYLKRKGDVIEDVCFEGHACTIATAATSIMTDLVKGKTQDEALRLIREYMKMMHLETFDKPLLQEAIVFMNVGKQSNRIGCATLGWRAVLQILNESGDLNV